MIDFTIAMTGQFRTLSGISTFALCIESSLYRELDAFAWLGYTHSYPYC